MTLNGLERRNGPYFALGLFHTELVYNVVLKQLLKSTFDSLWSAPLFNNYLGKTNCDNSVWWAYVHTWLAAKTFKNQLPAHSMKLVLERTNYEVGSIGVGAGLYMYVVVVKSSRSLSHLLMSSCLSMNPKIATAVMRYFNVLWWHKVIPSVLWWGIFSSQRECRTQKFYASESRKCFQQ